MTAETLKRAELVERLQKLAASEPPKDLSPGAMCYMPDRPFTGIAIPCPNCEQTMIMGEKDAILFEYNFSLEYIQDQGVDITLIIPEHCPQCGFGLQKTEFQLEIKYPDHPVPVRVKLETAHDLELMSLFLLGEDRSDEGKFGEIALRDVVTRLRELFGVKE